MAKPKKLDDLKVMTIRALHHCKPEVYSYRKLADYFGVNRNTIFMVLRGLSWSEVMFPIGEYAERLRARFINDH